MTAAVGSKLTDLVAGEIDQETRLLAAIAYGEGSPDDVEAEIAGIVHAVVNRAKAWGDKKVTEVVALIPITHMPPTART